MAVLIIGRFNLVESHAPTTIKEINKTAKKAVPTLKPMPKLFTKVRSKKAARSTVFGIITAWIRPKITIDKTPVRSIP